jgi:hypothetical protein
MLLVTGSGLAVWQPIWLAPPLLELTPWLYFLVTLIWIPVLVPYLRKHPIWDAAAFLITCGVLAIALRGVILATEVFYFSSVACHWVELSDSKIGYLCEREHNACGQSYYEFAPRIFEFVGDTHLMRIRQRDMCLTGPLF